MGVFGKTINVKDNETSVVDLGIIISTVPTNFSDVTGSTFPFAQSVETYGNYKKFSAFGVGTDGSFAVKLLGDYAANFQANTYYAVTYIKTTTTFSIGVPVTFSK